LANDEAPLVLLEAFGFFEDELSDDFGVVSESSVLLYLEELLRFFAGEFDAYVHLVL